MWILIIAIIVVIIVKLRKKNPEVKTAQPVETYKVPEDGTDILRNAPAPDPQIGYMNMPTFVVKGKKKSTNRMNTLIVPAINEDKAKEYAMERVGLMEPLEVSTRVFWAKSGLNEYDVTIPGGATEEDSEAFTNSCVERDGQHIPPAFMEYATSLGVALSWLSGRNSAAQKVLNSLDAKEKAALYGYAVHCSLKGTPPGNILQSSDFNLYYKFAEDACRDDKVWSSIANRPGSDIWAPSKRTTAYAFASDYFKKVP